MLDFLHIIRSDSAADQDSHLPGDGATVIRMHFLHAEGGLAAEETQEYSAASCFRLFADDEEIPAGEARIVDDMIELKARIPDGIKTIRISFAEEGYADVRIRNAAGLPVKPFHTELQTDLR